MFDSVRNNLPPIGFTACLVFGSLLCSGQDQPAKPLTDAQRQARAKHQAEVEQEYQRHPTLAIGAQAPDSASSTQVAGPGFRCESNRRPSCKAWSHLLRSP